jgi:DNA-binding Lrp family transcriptional regulator
VCVDPVRAGQHASAYVTLAVDQKVPWKEVRDQLMAIPEVHHVALIGGETDAIVLVRARDNRDLRRVVLEEIQAVPAVRGTRTQIIFEDAQRGSGALPRLKLSGGPRAAIERRLGSMPVSSAARGRRTRRP